MTASQGVRREDSRRRSQRHREAPWTLERPLPGLRGAGRGPPADLTKARRRGASKRQKPGGLAVAPAPLRPLSLALVSPFPTTSYPVAPTNLTPSPTLPPSLYWGGLTLTPSRSLHLHRLPGPRPPPAPQTAVTSDSLLRPPPGQGDLLHQCAEYREFFRQTPLHTCSDPIWW